jgi:succinate dehydrogenase / fumarate reductase flavoprotein subunit
LAEVDITKQTMEVGPTLHYFMGGIRVDADTQETAVPGLFACGECAAGLHGANRLGGNSLSDLLVFGHLAGGGAADYIQGRRGTKDAEFDSEVVATHVRTATSILNRESGSNPYLVHDKLQAVMQENAGIVRTGEQLQEAIAQLNALQPEIDQVKAPGASQYNAGWHEALDLSSMMLTSLAISKAALMREESRGAHTRLDFEGEREEWGKANVVVKKGADGTMSVRREERAPEPPELEAIAQASIEDLESGKVG